MCFIFLCHSAVTAMKCASFLISFFITPNTTITSHEMNDKKSISNCQDRSRSLHLVKDILFLLHLNNTGSSNFKRL